MGASIPAAEGPATGERSRPRWQELWQKEDWWAVWLGLGVVIVAYGLFAAGGSIGWIAVAPTRWSNLAQLGAHFVANADRYAVQFVLWLTLLSGAASAMGHRPSAFIPAFIMIYIFSILVLAAGTWDQAVRYNLEPPLVALVLG